MLARTFKSPADLGLTDKQHAALVKVLGMLEREELKYFNVRALDDFREVETDKAAFSGHFNMDGWCLLAECGTIGCIGGTAELVGRLEANELFHKADHNSRLGDLFYPPMLAVWSEITPDMAAHALRAYLTTGRADWSLAPRE